MEPREVAPIYQIQIYIQHTEARILKPQTLISSKAPKKKNEQNKMCCLYLVGLCSKIKNLISVNIFFLFHTS